MQQTILPMPSQLIFFIEHIMELHYGTFNEYKNSLKMDIETSGGIIYGMTDGTLTW